jgi:deazaflavin-dependent oxidoreductase (nitroreductase family)
VGARLITIYVVGRKSGRHYAVPVAFTRHDGALLVGTPFGWGRNLRTGEAVDIRLKGKRRRMDVAIVTEEDGVVENYAVMARDNRQFAKFNKISVDQAGEPNPAGLHLAWDAGARAFRFTQPDTIAAPGSAIGTAAAALTVCSARVEREEVRQRDDDRFRAS